MFTPLRAKQFVFLFIVNSIKSVENIEIVPSAQYRPSYFLPQNNSQHHFFLAIFILKVKGF